METFGTEARKVTREDPRRQAEGAGLDVLGLYGNRIANDLLVDDGPKHEPGFFADLLALELELCDREPFNRLGFGWQLLAERPA